MRRPLLVLALLLLGAAPAADAVPSAQTLTVTDFGDAPPGASSRDPGPVGSLRYILMREAKPGDAITFARPAEVLLTAPLIIPPDLHGIRILGSSGTGRAGLHDRSAVPHWRTSTGAGFGLVVKADNVRVEGLTFTDTPLVYSSGNPVDRLRGGTIHENLFNGRHGYLIVDRTAGTAVTENEFAGSQDLSIETSETIGLRLIDNTVKTTRRTAVTDTISERLEVVDNEFERTSFDYDQSAGTIRHNTFKEGTFEASDWASARAAGLTVVDNTFENTVAQLQGARQLVARDNDHRGAGLRVGCFAPNKDLPARRSIVAEKNTLERGGIVVDCGEKDMVRISDNTVTGARDAIFVEHGLGVALRGNKLSGNRSGVTVKGPSTARVERGFVRGSTRWGIAAGANARVEVRRVTMGGNGGAGIDLAPAGPTPNAARKSGNDDHDWPALLEFDRKAGKLRGQTCAGCRVEVYEAEEGGENGEGTRFLGSVTATRSGRFAYPAGGALDCPATGKLTVTSTRPGKDPVTSEFSQDIECGCLVRKNFIVGAPRTRTEVRSFGLRVLFPEGSKLERATLVDVVTEERPTADALGDMLRWEEVQREASGGPAGFFAREYVVDVSYKPDETGFAFPRRLWRFSIAYEPPRSTTGCAARATEIGR